MRKLIIFILLFVIICLSLSKDCFAIGGTPRLLKLKPRW